MAGGFFLRTKLIEDAERSANQQEIKGLQDDVRYLKGEVIEVERLYRIELDAHTTTKDKLEFIKGVLNGDIVTGTI